MSETMVTEALVNKQTGEVLEIGLQKTPDEIMLDARAAAQVLQKLIDENKRKPLQFNGKQYLEFPHWQTVGSFFHASASTGDAEFVEIGGVKGFKASARIVDNKTGLTVGGAEAFCLADEPNWQRKPLFQLASMAQTRAACKALSNKYRYVAILAGYEPTPAEEADHLMESPIRAPKQIVKPIEDEFSSPPSSLSLDGAKKISSKQRALLFARTRDANISEEVIKVYIKENFGITTTGDLTGPQLNQILDWLDAYKEMG